VHVKELGRCSWHGYYNNNNIFAGNYPYGLWQPDYLDWDKVQNRNQFITAMYNALHADFTACENSNSPANYTEGAANWPLCYRRKAIATHSSFIINSMMGFVGPDFDGQTFKAGIELAKENWNKPGTTEDFVGLIDLYETNNWIQWGAIINYRCSAAGSIPSWNSASWGRNTTWIRNCTSGEDDFRRTIRFNIFGTGRRYDIVQFCANVKHADALVDYNVNASLDPFNELPTEVDPGQTYSFRSRITNSGEWHSPAGTWLRIHNKQPPGNTSQNLSNDLVEHVSVSPDYPTSYAGSNASQNGYTTSDASKCGSPSHRRPCWYFEYDGQNNGPAAADNPYGLYNPGAQSAYGLLSTYTVTITFRVASDADAGEQICLLASATPQTRTDSEHTNGPRCMTVSAATKPYLRVYGNDVHAGAGFGEGCTVSDSDAAVKGHTRTVASGGNTLYAGAGVQFAATALGSIDQFYSASLRNPPTANPAAPLGLSFGNTGPGDVPVAPYGGSSGIGHCIPDYFQEGLDANLDEPGPVTIDAAGATTTISGQQTRYVDGNVIIRDNIAFANSGTGWSSIGDIPSYYLVVRGNIYIDRGVTSLDGVYVAQPRADGTGGEIYTCTNGGTPYALTALHTNCNSNLTVSGSFLANKVHFLRTKGDVATASPTEGVTDTDNVAEIFRFSQEYYLQQLDPELERVVPYQTYDYVTSLPPIL